MLGLDIGERRVGVAISDPGERVATPLKVLDARVLRDLTPLLRLLEDYEVGRIVVGLPMSLDGTEGPQARADDLAGRLVVARGNLLFDELHHLGGKGDVHDCTLLLRDCGRGHASPR